MKEHVSGELAVIESDMRKLTAENEACEDETKTAKRGTKEAKWEAADAKAERDRIIENLKLQMSSQREARVRFSDEPNTFHL